MGVRRAEEWKKGIAELRRSDRRLAKWIESQGEVEDFRIPHGGDPYIFLVKSIVGQQLSWQAADTIWGRLVPLFPKGQVSFSGLTKLSPARLRSVGMSRSKARSVLDLSRKVLDGTIPAPARLRTVPDEELIDVLCQVHGIGRWTAETYMIFRLGRMDIMPADDLVLRKGFARIILRSSTLPTPKTVREHAVCWSPYRTVAAKVLWSAG
jgi:3-methyladenine DNA glycosylase/8-oxoguanine DNA glycosylase